MEQLLGKKGAKGHRASKAHPGQQARKGTGSEEHAHRKDQPIDASDDEEGRAAMFTSKAPRKRKRELVKTEVTPPTLPDPDSHDAAEDPDRTNGLTAGSTDVRTDAAASRAPKKKPGSYLDEILGEKAKRIKKKPSSTA